MTNIEYFKYILKTDIVFKLDWYYSVMSLNPIDSKYVFTKDKKYYVYIDNDPVVIDNIDTTRPLILYTDSISLSNNELSNVKNGIDTTIGRAITNLLLLVRPFGNKIDFLNESFKSDKVEDLIVEKMIRDEISVDEYLKFVDSAIFLQGLSKVVTQGATIKSITPPDGLEEFKKKTIEEFNKTYGEDWVKDPIKAAEYTNKLKEFDKEYLKDDPTLNKTLTKKIQNNARLKQYMAFGSVDDFGDNPFILESLDKGMPKDKKKLTTYFNSIRQGSYSRGHETQKGGAVSKNLLRTASGITIVEGDCNSKMYKEVLVTPGNAGYLNFRYHLVGNKVVMIEDATKLIGQVLKLRTPLFCHQEGRSYCTTCCGKNYVNRENSIGLQMNNISDAILTSSLKAMHDTTIKLADVNILEIIK